MNSIDIKTKFRLGLKKIIRLFSNSHSTFSNVHLRFHEPSNIPKPIVKRFTAYYQTIKTNQLKKSRNCTDSNYVNSPTNAAKYWYFALCSSIVIRLEVRRSLNKFESRLIVSWFWRQLAHWLLRTFYIDIYQLVIIRHAFHMWNFDKNLFISLKQSI